MEVLEQPWGVKRGVVVCGNDIRAHCGTPCLVGAVKAARRKHQEGEKRLGAMNDPVLGASGVVTQSPESIVLADDEDVEGWLASTKAAPLGLLAILVRVSATGETAEQQTPPPTG